MSTDSFSVSRHRQPARVAETSLKIDAEAILEEQWRRQLEDVVALSCEALEDPDHRDETGARTTEQHLSSKLLRAARQQLEETGEAIKRLEDGIYGLCSECHEAISPARLEVLPAARQCVVCQSRNGR
ncbi:MAG: TraR/DksA C4-type zinc finger protein [Mycobacteriales bacterium]